MPLRRGSQLVLSVEYQGVHHVALLPALVGKGGILLEDLAHVGDADLFRGWELCQMSH